MNVVDTDALSHHLKRNAIDRAIEAHLAAPGADFQITAVSAYEMLGGAVELCFRLKRDRRDLVPGFNLIRGSSNIWAAGREECWNMTSTLVAGHRHRNGRRGAAHPLAARPG